MLRTGIPASYWDAAPGAEVRTALELLNRDSDDVQSAARPATGGGGEVLVSGSQARR